VSKRIARSIVALANFITLPLKPHRRMATKAAASELLAANVPVETSRGRLLFFTNSQRAYHYPWFFHDDEPDTLAWIESFPENSCLWDIGANIGAFSLYAALKPETIVLAFEPSGSSFATLTKNIEINRMDDRVSAYCLAFAKNTELSVLNMAQTEAGHSMHGFGTNLNAYDETIDTQFRQAAIGYAIDDFVGNFAPTPPTHIKIDVDGIEADILRGGEITLKNPSVQSVLVEIIGDMNSPRNTEIISVMTGLGFTARPKASPAYRNVTFEREAR
jgi:FkbM family methyltransferase